MVVTPRFDCVSAAFPLPGGGGGPPRGFRPPRSPGRGGGGGLTLEYMAPLRTRPLRIQMMEAAGLALSAWQVRLRWSPARRLTTGEPTITGSSGGTAGEGKERRVGLSVRLLTQWRGRSTCWFCMVRFWLAVWGKKKRWR